MRVGSLCSGYGGTMVVTMPKGIYDRDASGWTPKAKKSYPPALVTEVRRLYEEENMTMREVAAATSTSVKILQRLMPRHGIDRRPATPRNQTGTANSGWKGDKAGYKALHLRVRTERGEPFPCSRCASTTASRYEWANLTGDYANPYDYAAMCVPCHRRFDAAAAYQTLLDQ